MVDIETYEPKQDYKVLCYCCTYNQAQYITDTMNGFAMQKTNFPFVCLIIDDCSTDGEQEVIQAWIERECDMKKVEHVELELSNVLLVPHKTNENCTFAIYLLKRNLWKEPTLKEACIEIIANAYTNLLGTLPSLTYSDKKYKHIFELYICLFASIENLYPS